MTKLMPEREGLYVWRTQDSAGNSWASQIVRDVMDSKINDLYVKVANANYAYNTYDDSANLEYIFSALRDDPVRLWGWHYVYLDDPVGEADIAYEMITKYNLAGYVINAEGHAKGKNANARTFIERLRGFVGEGYTLGLSSYRYPNYHPELPWKEFLSIVDFNQPQIYWVLQQNSVEQIDLTLQRTRAYEELLGIDPTPIHPLLCAYSDDPLEWKPKETAMIEGFEHVKALGLPSAAWYEWKASYEINRWDVIRDKTDWESAPEPEPDDTPYSAGDLDAAFTKGYVMGWKERKEAVSQRIFSDQEPVVPDETFASADPVVLVA